ncbi:hypothetical protein IP88_00670 [alpha proteobacterium AAP81b]|nr:hypothetical protein IP88_00670 [alpha proteobacterium AAP81b]
MKAAALRPLLLTSVGLAAIAALAFPVTAHAQAAAPEAGAATAPTPLPAGDGDLAAPGEAIDFAADELEYKDDSQLIVATGTVEIRREGWTLRADRVEYYRDTGIVVASGHVISTDPEGNQAFGERIELKDTLRDAAIENILIVLNDGGRLAAQRGARDGDLYTLDRAVYSPCSVIARDGCPQKPLWQVKARRIRYNRARQRIRYRDAQLDFLGLPILFLPNFSHPDTQAPQASGLLVPELEFRRQLGFGVSLPYHFALGRDRDITVAPHFYTSENPALELNARRLFRAGPVEASAFFTYANLTDFAPDNVTAIDRGDQFRGYFSLRGRLQHSPEWRSTFSLRLTTDDTFNRRWGLDFDDTLRSTYALERTSPESYLSISGWGFQGLRATDRSGEIPFVLPLIEYDWRPGAPILGGRLRIAANSMNLLRGGGQSVQRGLAFAEWNRRFLTPFGQRITITGLVRGDLYNVTDPDLATLPEYAGRSGVQGRGLALGAVDVEWPFAGPALGGTQTITPRVQLIAAPSGLNRGIPNEDSRAIELEDVSLFDLNRFPGYDRVEDGTRLTWGLQYALDRRNVALRTEIGQSIRLTDSGNEFPGGTGLPGTFSDFVGRTSLKIGSLFEIVHRFRVDRNSFNVRRNEIDISVGNRRTYATIGYLKLDRKITVEDLEDREELRVGGRVAFARYWSAFGSAIIDLTSRAENPLAAGNGFSAIRHRVGAEYEDECFRFGVSWRRDYVSDRDFRAGDTFLITLAFKTLGGAPRP